jgi:hypothetical protein
MPRLRYDRKEIEKLLYFSGRRTSSPALPGDPMKKQVKKMTLTKETLSRLEQNLGHVAGGITAVADCGSRTCQPPYSGCEWSNGQQTCFTCAGTCTTNYC